MPQLKGKKPVPPVQDLNLARLPPDTQVYYNDKTGEAFADYESYVNRLKYLHTRQFSCEFSGKSGLDFFAATESEKQESRVVSQRFPDQLKGRVLQTLQFQVIGRMDQLVDAVYDRYKDRFFPGEKVFVDLSGDKYFARVAKVFPPSVIRALAAQRAAQTPAKNEGPSNGHPNSDPDDFTPVAHHFGIDLNQDPAIVTRDDNAEAYLYTVQLMDENHNFEGSFMEVPSKQLSRDRLTFSKSILKRYMRECVQREPLIAAPWVVKPAIAAIFGISGEQSEEAEAKNREIREGKLAKRRKNVDEDGVPLPPKRRRAEPGERKQPVELKKALKYPIEDLELDPLTIHDGRTLRRVNQELPPLPPKPKPSRDLLVPAALFDDFIVVWNMLNVFGKAIGLSTFSLDDFASALHHHTLEPSCVLLAEVHACLTNIIGSDHSRVYGQTGAAPLPFGATSAAQADDGLLTRSSSMAPEAQAMAEVDELAADGGLEAEGAEVEVATATEEDREFDALIRKGVNYSRRWDRSAKLKLVDGREGWERHMVGALCQRGGPIVMDSLHGILRHLFDGADLSPPVAGSSAVESAHAAVGAVKADNSHPEAAYLSLALEDKLAILNYLCTLALGSKAVRSYIEECEVNLTDLRKQRADVNKERKALLERRAELEGKNKKEEVPAKAGSATGTPAPEETPAPTLLPPGSPETAEANGHANGNGDAPTLPPPSELASEADLAVKADEMQAAVDEAGEDEDMLDDAASETVSVAGSSVAGGGGRKASKPQFASLEPQRSLSASKQRAEARLLKLSAREIERAQRELDGSLAANAKSEDRVEREFRRFKNVSRCQPLGKDRFHCRYWWFDGVGGMSLVGGVHGTSVQYGTGRLLVQGPSEQDWEGMCARKAEGDEEASAVKAEEGAEAVAVAEDTKPVRLLGEEGLRAKRVREEVEDESILGVNEWAYYDDEAQLEELLLWLNAKGTREHALRNALNRWRGYFLAGAKKRQADTAPPQVEDPASRRSSRRGGEAAEPGYLGWRNKLAKA